MNIIKAIAETLFGPESHAKNRYEGQPNSYMAVPEGCDHEYVLIVVDSKGAQYRCKKCGSVRK